MTEKAFIIQLHQLDYKYHLIFGQSVIFNCKKPGVKPVSCMGSSKYRTTQKNT